MGAISREMGVSAFALANAAMANYIHDDIEADFIIDKISECTGVSRGDILGLSRKRPKVYARHYCMYLIHRDLNYGPSRIGKIFKRDHSTVIHAIKNVKAMIFTKDSEFKMYMNGLI